MIAAVGTLADALVDAAELLAPVAEQRPELRAGVAVAHMAALLGSDEECDPGELGRIDQRIR